LQKGYQNYTRIRVGDVGEYDGERGGYIQMCDAEVSIRGSNNRHSGETEAVMNVTKYGQQ
jgi:hypothetical protein